jgi:DNA-binding CsgD family transcriptional regulator/RNase P subunit RPR2
MISNNIGNFEGVDYLLEAIFGEPDTIPELRTKFKRFYIGKKIEDVIKKILLTLTPRQQEVIKLRFGLFNNSTMTLKDVGIKLGISRSRVSQIELKALRRLRHPARTRLLKPYFPTSLDKRLELARGELFKNLSNLYPFKIALTVTTMIHNNELHEALKSTESALRFSCGTNITYCVHCNKPLPPNWLYCDVHCRSKWNILTLICDNCGKVFERPKSQFLKKDLTPDKTFCSNGCFRSRGRKGDKK